jgi:hypothetical protein
VFSNKLGNFFKSLKKSKADYTDIHTHMYVKNMLFLKRYKEKLNENTKFILKNFIKIIFNKNLRTDIFIKRKVIKQNIILLKAKEK